MYTTPVQPGVAPVENAKNSESAVQQKQQTCRVKLPNLRYISHSSEGGISPAGRKRNPKARRTNTTSQVVRRKINPQPKDVAMRQAHLNIINKYKKFMHTRPDVAETSEGDENADDPPPMRRSGSKETIILAKICDVDRESPIARRRLFDDCSEKRQGDSAKDQGSPRDGIAIDSPPRVPTSDSRRQPSASHQLTRSLTIRDLDSSEGQAALTGSGFRTSRCDTPLQSTLRRAPAYDKSRLRFQSRRESPLTPDASPSSPATRHRRPSSDDESFHSRDTSCKIRGNQSEGGSRSNNRTPSMRESSRNSSLTPRSQSPAVVIRRRPVAAPTPQMAARGSQQQRSFEPLVTNSIRKRANIPQEMVQITEGVTISRDAWEVMLHKPDSRFVKDVAVLLWGEDELAERCIDARQANRNLKDGESPRTELTPEKYETVKDCLFHKLTEAKVEGIKRAARMSKVWKYISNKIYDVRKSKYLRLRNRTATHRGAPES